MQQCEGRRDSYRNRQITRNLPVLCKFVLYHLPASQIALQVLWITDAHNWCPSIEL